MHGRDRAGETARRLSKKSKVACPGRVQRALLRERNETDLGLARDRQLNDASQVNRTRAYPAHDAPSAIRVAGCAPSCRSWVPGSRYARPGHGRAQPRLANEPLAVISIHAFTMSNSAVFFVPATRSASGFVCPVRLGLARGFGVEAPLTQRQTPLQQSHSPRTRGGWSADRRTLLVVSRVRGATIARATRAVPLQPGRPLGAPPWRFSAGDPRRHLRQWHRICAAACPPPGARPGGTGSRASRGAVRAAAAGRHSSLRLQDRLRTTPLMSEDANVCTTNSLRSQEISTRCSRKNAAGRALCAADDWGMR